MRSSLLRNVFAVLDFLPIGGIVALISMSLTKNAQRLGDLVAGTLVVIEPEKIRKLLPHQSAVSPAIAKHQLPTHVYQLLSDFVARANSLLPEARDATRSALIQILAQLDLHKAHGDDTDHWLSLTLQNSEPQRSFEVAHSAGPSIAWNVVQERTKKALEEFRLYENRGKLQEHEIRKLAERYQDICQLYGYLASFYPQTGEAADASHAVREGRRLIYGRRLEQLTEVRQPFASRVHSGYLAARVHILFAIFFFFLSAALSAALAYIHPGLAWSFLSEEAAAELTRGKLWTDDIPSMSSLVSSQIIVNNVRVTILVFALGITAGIGTLWLLLFNGALLGAIFFILTKYDMAQRLAEFVVAHGVLEISVILVSAGCGLAIGDALIHPGTQKRLHSLKARARQLIDLLFFSACALFVAGVVEGHISPAPSIPVPIKVGLGLTLGILYWGVIIVKPKVSAWGKLDSSSPD